MEPPIVYQRNNYIIIKCPYCLDFNLMGNGFFSSRQLEDYENHAFSCRSNKINDIIELVIDENHELLEKLDD